MENQGERLKSARTAAGFLSAREAALRHGWNVSTYTAHENGQNGITTKAAGKYATAFKTTPEWLLLGRDLVEVKPDSIDDQLHALPPEVAKELLIKFNDMIEGIRLALKIK